MECPESPGCLLCPGQVPISSHAERTPHQTTQRGQGTRAQSENNIWNKKCYFLHALPPVSSVYSNLLDTLLLCVVYTHVDLQVVYMCVVCVCVCIYMVVVCVCCCRAVWRGSGAGWKWLLWWPRGRRMRTATSLRRRAHSLGSWPSPLELTS